MDSSEDRIKSLEDDIRRLKKSRSASSVFIMAAFGMSFYLFLFTMGGLQPRPVPGSLKAETFWVAEPGIELPVASLDYDHIGGGKLSLDGLVVDEKKRGVSISPSRIKLRQNDWVDGAFAGGGVDLILIEVTDDGPRMTFRNHAGEVTGTFP